MVDRGLACVAGACEIHRAIALVGMEHWLMKRPCRWPRYCWPRMPSDPLSGGQYFADDGVTLVQIDVASRVPLWESTKPWPTSPWTGTDNRITRLVACGRAIRRQGRVVRHRVGPQKALGAVRRRGGG